jgi:hypothetical protein
MLLAGLFRESRHLADGLMLALAAKNRRFVRCHSPDGCVP